MCGVFFCTGKYNEPGKIMGSTLKIDLVPTNFSNMIIKNSVGSVALIKIKDLFKYKYSMTTITKDNIGVRFLTVKVCIDVPMCSRSRSYLTTD